MGTVIAILGLSLGYATLRYNVFKGIPWTEWPTLTVNKGVAMAVLLLMVGALVLREPGRRRRMLSASGRLLLVHLALSLVLLGPVSYPSFFQEGKPTGLVALSLLLGAIGAATVPSVIRADLSFAAPHAFLRLGLFAFLAGLHAALLGLGNWWHPSGWPGGMPPITLISFLAGLAGLLAGFRMSRSRGEPPICDDRRS